MNAPIERPWLAHYPKGVAADIDFGKYNCLTEILDEYLQKFASKPAYQCMGKTLTFREIDEKSKAFGAYLLSRGLQPGDKIALMMPNLLQYPIALFGALRAGLIVVNTNPLYTAREIQHQFNDAGVKAVLIAENFAAELQKVLANTPVKMVFLTSIGEMLGFLKGMITDFVVRNVRKMVPAYQIPNAVWFSSALKVGKSLTLKSHRNQLDDTICIQYTGGTTGVAKGAELTNRNLIANMLQVKAWIASADIHEGKDVMLTPLPLYHIFSFTVNCLCMASFGAQSVLVTNPRDIPGLVKTIKATKPTLVTGVNTLFNALLNSEDFRNIDFKAMRFKAVVGGAMAIQRAVAERWLQVTGMPLTEGFGMTESSPVVCVNPLDKPQTGTIGLPISSTYVRIADADSGQIMATGERGEIQVYGPQVMKGYYNRPDETAKTITADGWLRTGDIGIMDERGFVQIVDRLKDMILVSGFNVYPNEVEDVVVMNPKVAEAAAIGVPDGKSGEAVKIFVVKKDESLTEAEILEHCRQHLTAYKNPRFVEFRTELPKTNVGKILRRELRDAELKKK